MKHKPNEQTYIYPPRATEVIHPRDNHMYTESGWIAQLKYNDSRCLIKYRSNGTIELWNRHGEGFRNYTLPQTLHDELESLRARLDIHDNEWTLLDGGLLHAKHSAIKDHIVLWDILVHNGEQLLGTTYEERYAKLAKLSSLEMIWDDQPIGDLAHTRIIIPRNYKSTDEPWNIVKEVNKNYDSPLLEGVVLKDPTGTLGIGVREKNNSDWMVRSRVQTGRHLF